MGRTNEWGEESRGNLFATLLDGRKIKWCVNDGTITVNIDGWVPDETLIRGVWSTSMANAKLTALRVEVLENEMIQLRERLYESRPHADDPIGPLAGEDK